MSGKLILSGSDPVTQELVAVSTLFVPKDTIGALKRPGNCREQIVIERGADEEANGAKEAQ